MGSNKTWFARNYRDGNLEVAMFDSQRYAPGDTVIFNDAQWEEALGDFSLLVSAETATVGGKLRVSRVSFGSRFEGELPLWFTLIDDTRNNIAAILLLSFADDRFPEGVIASMNETQGAQVNPQEAAASLSWLVSSGVIQQIKVSPKNLDNQIASRLLLTAEILAKVHDWPELSTGLEENIEDELLAASP